MHWLANLRVDELDFEVNWHPFPALYDVGSDLLTENEVRSDNIIRRHDACAVGTKDFQVRRGLGEFETIRLIMRGLSPFRELNVVATMNDSFLYTVD